MQADDKQTGNRLTELREEMEQQQRNAERRAKTGIAVRAALIVFVFAYMTWLSGAVTRLDAQALTQLAATHIEERLPELRAELGAFAIKAAPGVTDQARDLLLALPGSLRGHVEGPIVAELDRLMTRFETDVDAAITIVVDDQMALVRDAMSDADPEAQLDAIVLGVSDAFRETMIGVLDELHVDYANEIQRLNTRLVRLQRVSDLSPSERIDKQLLEVWMTLVHRHGITDPLEVAWEFEQAAR